MGDAEPERSEGSGIRREQSPTGDRICGPEIEDGGEAGVVRLVVLRIKIIAHGLAPLCASFGLCVLALRLD